MGGCFGSTNLALLAAIPALKFKDLWVVQDRSLNAILHPKCDISQLGYGKILLSLNFQSNFGHFPYTSTLNAEVDSLFVMDI